jgi:deoxyribodipyrimidine photolyase-related protein
MAKLILILGDQLSPALASLRQWQPGDEIIMAEVAAEATYVKHHKHKIILIFSAMRHFAATLSAQGMKVHYYHYSQQQPSLLAAIQDTLQQHPKFNALCCTEPGEYRLWHEMQQWQHTLGLPVQLLEDDRFIASHAMFERWAQGRQQFRMEYFYREMRRYTGLLMRGAEPEGGQWNYDADNRKACSNDVKIPPPLRTPPDAITAEVQALVATHFSDHMGDVADFAYAVTGKDARAEFLAFCQHQLPLFGQYQDAMLVNQPFLFHSLCSAYLNCGLLDARWMCQKVAAAYEAGTVPLNAAEGFIRQIIGWREYVRGIYWLKMPDYKEQNSLAATRDLPSFYWHGNTKMRCMQQAVNHTIRHAYSHHIQRLMITGNFALIAGLSIEQVTDWYLAVYADAYEWVELPNTLGMALFADGGLLASKPYAASGNYINKMSNYCQHCHYNVKETTSGNACPFNALYWDFIARQQPNLGNNARMQLAFQQWKRKSPAEQEALQQKAQALFIAIETL